MSPVTFRPAKREAVGLLIGLAGASGSGKSFSALRLARGLAGNRPFAALDTEANRLLHYADRFQPWEHAELGAPFTPARYAEAIAEADKAGYPVIVLDSASHEHAGEGGLLDMQEAEFQRLGARDAVKMTSWIKPKMEHKRFVSRLLQVRAHIILCLRAEEKVDIIDDPERPGKKKIVPKRTLTGLDGWTPICEKNLPFELTMSLLLTPDAPGIPKPIKLQDQHRPFLPLDRPISEETGVELAKWAAGGTEPKPPRRRGAKAAEAAEPAETSEAPALTTRLLDLAAQLGRRDDVATAIADNRRDHTTDMPVHVAWLKRQIELVEKKLADRPDQDLKL